MQDAETVLGVLRERGRKGLPCEELYRQMYNVRLYLLAYGRIYSNHGAMTPGATPETADGMSMEKIGAIIEAMRNERYRFSPAQRKYIPKKNGKLRPLGLPTWSDKLVGEVVRLLLEAYYEPQFSDRSHGFRPRRGCHTALSEIATNWTGTTWFIEGDISDCFSSLDHDVMVKILAEKIHDNRFLRLVRNMLTAGYLEDWRWNATLSGCPQGGVVSPVLSSIYLHKLDEYVETVLIPQHTRGRAAGRTRPTPRRATHWRGRAGAMTGRKPGNCASNSAACPGVIHVTPATAGSGTPAMPTTTFWVSPGQRPKPRPSKISWRRSCVMNSSWNSIRKRR
ncbi:MAG TPA: reverse transcriptase/maturase family protein [Streptosporangiaceae bacterium]|nr:reverse transcriptase/maturase family protein [Streptosporangiaceae bacterium]